MTTEGSGEKICLKHGKPFILYRVRKKIYSILSYVYTTRSQHGGEVCYSPALIMTSDWHKNGDKIRRYSLIWTTYVHNNKGSLDTQAYNFVSFAALQVVESPVTALPGPGPNALCFVCLQYKSVITMQTRINLDFRTNLSDRQSQTDQLNLSSQFRRLNQNLHKHIQLFTLHKSISIKYLYVCDKDRPLN